MADRDGERVARVFRFQRRRQPEQEATMRWTWDFSARPYPTTLILTSSGEYSARITEASATARRATPRTCESFKALFGFTAKKTSSTAAESGRYSESSDRNSVAIFNRRRSSLSFGVERMQPAATIRCEMPSLSITP